MMREIFRKFINWTDLKFNLHISKDVSFYFHEKEIWWASLGQNIGSEQNGKNINFERPILIFKKFNHQTFLGIPMSSQLKNSPYHYIFDKDDRQYCLNLSQIRVLSSKRLLRKIDRMNTLDFDRIKNQFHRVV